MNRPVRTGFLALILAFLAVTAAFSQVMVVPSAAPTMTAEQEAWYQAGEPITYAGHFYYPSGPEVFFSPAEMVRSGFFGGIPLYSRTTIEPYSVVYVPLAGGRMQPYARPRDGELTGTTGSLPSTLPEPAATVPPAGLAPQAQGPPAQTTVVVPMQVRPEGMDASRRRPGGDEQPVGTTGSLPTYEPRHTRIGDLPRGAQAIFIEFDGARWYPQGPAQAIEPARLTRVGEYHGFAVWSATDGKPVIFIPVTPGNTLAVPYAQTRRDAVR